MGYSNEPQFCTPSLLSYDAEGSYVSVVSDKGLFFGVIYFSLFVGHLA